MSKRALHVAFLLILMSVVVAGGLTLEAKPDKGKGRFLPCPFPPCLAPCAFPPQPEVLCKTDDGVIETSFACCCCGSAGNRYRPL